MTLLSLVRSVRLLLDDYGGDLFSSAWETDDSGCQTSNATLVEYLDEARQEYCQRKPIKDATSTLTQVTATALLEGMVTLDSRILGVVSVVESATGDLLERVAVPRLDRDYPGWRAETGTPWAWLDDESDGQLRVWPIPTTDLALRLNVHRGPLTALAWASRNTEIGEIPVAHHAALAYWAAKRAMEGKDEINNRALGDSWEAKWLMAVGPKPTVKQMQVRAHISAGLPKVRGIGLRGRRSAYY